MVRTATLALIVTFFATVPAFGQRYATRVGYPLTSGHHSMEADCGCDSPSMAGACGSCRRCCGLGILPAIGKTINAIANCLLPCCHSSCSGCDSCTPAPCVPRCRPCHLPLFSHRFRECGGCGGCNDCTSGPMLLEPEMAPTEAEEIAPVPAGQARRTHSRSRMTPAYSRNPSPRPRVLKQPTPAKSASYTVPSQSIVRDAKPLPAAGKPAASQGRMAYVDETPFPLKSSRSAQPGRIIKKPVTYRGQSPEASATAPNSREIRDLPKNPLR